MEQETVSLLGFLICEQNLAYSDYFNFFPILVADMRLHLAVSVYPSQRCVASHYKIFDKKQKNCIFICLDSVELCCCSHILSFGTTKCVISSKIFFLVTDTRLYTLPCRSVRPSVGPSVTHSLKISLRTPTHAVTTPNHY